jgi:hypothetical protein
MRELGVTRDNKKYLDLLFLSIILHLVTVKL